MNERKTSQGIHIFEAAQKYKGLYTTSGGSYYYADENGLHNVPWEDIENNTWQKYIQQK